MHGVDDRKDIGHDFEAPGSHLGLSIFVRILQAKHKMTIDNLLLF